MLCTLSHSGPINYHGTFSLLTIFSDANFYPSVLTRLHLTFSHLHHAQLCTHPTTPEPPYSSPASLVSPQMPAGMIDDSVRIVSHNTYLGLLIMEPAALYLAVIIRHRSSSRRCSDFPPFPHNIPGFFFGILLMYPYPHYCGLSIHRIDRLPESRSRW